MFEVSGVLEASSVETESILIDAEIDPNVTLRFSGAKGQIGSGTGASPGTLYVRLPVQELKKLLEKT